MPAQHNDHCIAHALHVIAAALLAPEPTTTEMLAAIGVRHEPCPGSHGYRMLYAGDVAIGPMHVMQANAFIIKAGSAA
jgi:hypothetical protein